MNTEELSEYIRGTFGAEPEHLWAKYPEFAVFRRGDNRKWFAVVMKVSGRKLGLASDEETEIANVKCGPQLSGMLRGEAGIFPAYHMNKESWVSVSLDGTVEDEKIRSLLELSYSLTANKKRK